MTNGHEGFFLGGVMKMFLKLDCFWLFHNSKFTKKSLSRVANRGEFLWYTNYASVKLLQKNHKI